MDSPINKTDLIENVAESTGLSKADSTRALGAFLEAIEKGLVDGRKIAIAGFGSLETKQRAARAGRNPQTGETIEIAASVAISFKAAKALKEAVNEACIEA